MPVAIAKLRSKIYIEYFLHLIPPQLILILINKYILSKGGGEQGGIKSRILDTPPHPTNSFANFATGNS